ncbi:hydroxyisourate hydrolase [Paenibacillus wulumuqiensis]|uniref:hydroxyisourate hydrolase n=1 Tax=Paenibacillus wulumuqiensis TaxID=1567107 RepID=UPI0006191591|nr:hydroxyisourate hydrolase [Paenibacillus wulumuqiensis]
MSGKLTTHVLDLGQGGPAVRMRVELYAGDFHTLLAAGTTNADGRLDEPLLSGETMQPGMYELIFHAGDYLAAQTGQTTLTLWDRIPIRFTITDEQANYHIPLLLSPGGYSTYRGS